MNEKEQAAREAVIAAGKKLLASGLIARTWGNVSARLSEEDFLITGDQAPVFGGQVDSPAFTRAAPADQHQSVQQEQPQQDGEPEGDRTVKRILPAKGQEHGQDQRQDSHPDPVRGGNLREEGADVSLDGRE